MTTKTADIDLTPIETSCAHLDGIGQLLIDLSTSDFTDDHQKKYMAFLGDSVRELSGLIFNTAFPECYANHGEASA